MHLFSFKHLIMEQSGQDGEAGGNSGDKSEQKESIGASGTQNDSEQSGTVGEKQKGNDFSVESLPKEAQDIIKNLRSENAKYRTDRNNLNTRLEKIEGGFRQMFGENGDSQELTPEQQMEKLQGSYESLSFENAIMGFAYENGIPKENYEYFDFLMNKETNALEEGQELDEESLMEIVQKAKGFNNSSSDANTSVGGEKGKDPNQKSELNLESFAKMSLTEKSELYRKSPDIYNSLMKQAKDKRLL